ncbi:hypothetical protein FC54_GL001108 [Ligilactobacillus saerimneri DSM 16049]|nr:hypothetical protein FC54_GL001108 [Ligilactobacillus saerimneri DSM 16049]
MSQSELAKIIGVTQTTITAWETGKAEPASSAVANLADYFGVTTDYLLGRPEEKKEKDSNSVDLADMDALLTYQGKQIPDQDRELINDLLKRLQG